jgi:hypothetical protein
MIDKIEPGPTVQAHNLVVDQTNTYFVGKHRLLVHDNMPRRITDLPVPGWERKDTSDPFFSMEAPFLR